MVAELEIRYDELAQEYAVSSRKYVSQIHKTSNNYTADWLYLLENIASKEYTIEVKKKDDVLFVILNYKGWQETLACMDAVLAQSYKNFHVLLIENGSGDESPEKLKKYKNRKRVLFQENEQNLGFSGGVNQGINYAIKNSYPYLVLLNNDAVLTKNWLEALMRTMQRQDASVATGLLLSGDGKKIEHTGDGYSYWGLPFPIQRDEPVEQAHKSGPVFGGTAGASLYKTELFKDIGLFDENFFAYFEDTDINLRAQLAGHSAYYEKDAVAYHDHGTTSSKIPGFTVYQTFKNLPQVYWKNIPLALLFPVGWRFFGCYWLMYIRAVLRGQFSIATKGMLMSLVHFPHAIKQRWNIQGKRRVSARYMKSVMYPDLPPNNKRTAWRIFHR